MEYKEKLKNYIDRILKWSDGIKDENGVSFSHYPSEPQLKKVHEEVHELVQAILDNNETEQMDAIGDIFVTLIVYAEKAMNEKEYSVEMKEKTYNSFANEIEKETEVYYPDEDVYYLDTVLSWLANLNSFDPAPSKIHIVERSLVNLAISTIDYSFLECIDLAVNTIEQRLTDGRLYIENGVVKKDKLEKGE